MFVKLFKLFLCVGSFVYTSYVLCNFMYFLSSHTSNNRYSDYTSADEKLWDTLSSLRDNAALIGLFILQHSSMSSVYLKSLYQKLRMEDIERSIFNLSSAFVLNFLMTHWKQTSWFTLWDISTQHKPYLWMTMISIHVIAWVIIYSGCLMLDVSELAGIKQIYYSLSARKPPMTFKSPELQQFLSHMRHPSLIGFLIIFCVHPIMSLDRLLMAIILGLYMLVIWDIDYFDYNYHKAKMQRKKLGLSSY